MRRERESSGVVRASGTRRMLATAIDVAVGIAAMRVSLRRRARPRAPEAGRLGVRWVTLVGPTSELVREQLGTPGQWVAGIRTVDRRTGERVAPWRTLLLIATRLAGDLFVKRRSPGADPALRAARAHMGHELRAIDERYAHDPDARDAAMRELFARQPPHSGPARSIAPLAALSLATTLLRRRIAPTTEVDVRTFR